MQSFTIFMNNIKFYQKFHGKNEYLPNFDQFFGEKKTPALQKSPHNIIDGVAHTQFTLVISHILLRSKFDIYRLQHTSDSMPTVSLLLAY